MAVYRMSPDSNNIEVNTGGVVIHNHSQIKALRFHFGSGFYFGKNQCSRLVNGMENRFNIHFHNY